MKSNSILLCLAVILGCSHMSRAVAWEYAIKNDTKQDAKFWIDQKWATGSGNFWVTVPAGQTKTFKVGEASWPTYIQKGDNYQESGRTDVTKLDNWKGQSGWDASHGQQVGPTQGTFLYTGSGFVWQPNGWTSDPKVLPEGSYKKTTYGNEWKNGIVKRVEYVNCRGCLYNKWSDTLRCECVYEDTHSNIVWGRTTQASGCKRYTIAANGQLICQAEDEAV